MSSSQVATPYRQVPFSVLAVLLAIAFAIGALTGLGLPRVLEGPSHPRAASAAVTPKSFTGAAENNMSDAVRAAQLAGAAKPFKGAADNNMSDASRIQPFKGVADNNMSDAVYQARYGSK
jgi:hypothetical protein